MKYRAPLTRPVSTLNGSVCRWQSSNKVRPETRKQNADKHIRRNARVCKHAVSLKSLPESCWFIRTSFASLATFVPHSPTRDLQLTWTRWKALARHRHAQHTHTHTAFDLLALEPFEFHLSDFDYLRLAWIHSDFLSFTWSDSELLCWHCWPYSD